MPKIIGFLGTTPADICLYTAFVLQNTGSDVCVVDNSGEGVLYGAVPTPDSTLARVTCRNVDFLRKEPLVQWQELPCEYVLVQLGDEPKQLCVAACDETVLVIDCERSHLDFYGRFMRQLELPMSVVLRGYCPDGISGKKLKEYFERENCFIKKWLTLPLDEMDEAYRIGMQYEPIRAYRHVSAGMEKVLVQLVRTVHKADPVKIMRAVRAAKSGKVL